MVDEKDQHNLNIAFSLSLKKELHQDNSNGAVTGYRHVNLCFHVTERAQGALKGHLQEIFKILKKPKCVVYIFIGSAHHTPY